MLQSGLMILYTMFVASQWFMLGKEIDHKLSIFFRVNSSFDRILYRLLLGMFFFILYFNLLYLLPPKWTNNMFWVTWIILGLFYSWPTRGKIIRESVSSYFGEFKYLDNFERTLLLLIISLFVISMPELPSLNNLEALKLFFDPLEKINNQFWNFITVNYYPFKKYPTLFRTGWSIYFYFICMGLFLIGLYSTLRYFVSRRLSLLGVFVLLSSWSYSKILANNFGDALFTTYSLIWVWSLLWVSKSSSYRVGLFIGLIGYYGTIIDQSFVFLTVLQLLLLYFFFLNLKTRWFRLQILRYALFGIILTTLTVLFNMSGFENMTSIDSYFTKAISKIFYRKSFFILAPIGLIILFVKLFFAKKSILRQFSFDLQIINQFFALIGFLIIYANFFGSYLVVNFSIMWVLTILSVIPLEIIFQSITRLRSSRNLIYLIYIVICLLDSHFEGRLKIFFRLLES